MASFERLKLCQEDFVDNLRFEGGLEDLLVNKRVISEVQSKTLKGICDRKEKGKQLMEIIVDQVKNQVNGYKEDSSELSSFTEALRETDQPHLVNILTRESKYKNHNYRYNNNHVYCDCNTWLNRYRGAT